MPAQNNYAYGGYSAPGFNDRANSYGGPPGMAAPPGLNALFQQYGNAGSPPPPPVGDLPPPPVKYDWYAPMEKRESAREVLRSERANLNPN
ncbi:hypothetical protein LTR66_014424 [Elasticomyces elasticus]|nr:hypothetical protein LTR66_014424 [Elasticomyces elasticus]